MTNAELFAFLFADLAFDAEEMLTRWIVESRRFQAFVVENRSKIRKKLRSAQTPESVRSLLLELDVARRFVEDARCRVAYEKYGPAKERSPDCTVTLRNGAAFNLEATLIRIDAEGTGGRMEKLTRIVCGKLGQMVPRMANCLAIGTEGSRIGADEASAAMKALKRGVEQKDDALLARAGFATPSDFFGRFLWLSAIVFLPALDPVDAAGALWENPQARLPLQPQMRDVLRTAFPAADPSSGPSADESGAFGAPSAS